MKSTLKTVFNHLSMGFRLLHATHIKKDRETYLTYLESAYDVQRADIAKYSRDDLRKIFKDCNRRAALSACKLILSGAWAGLGVAETINIHKKAQSALFWQKCSEEYAASMDALKHKHTQPPAERPTPIENKAEQTRFFHEKRP